MQDLQSYFQEQLPRIEENLSKQIGALNPIVLPVAEHILKSGGKRFRPLLCILTAQALGYQEENIYPLACALEMIHSATLLHDDVLDNAEYRRGQKAAHLKFGISETILAGDALLSMANKIVCDYKNISLMSNISEAIHQTATGEILEIQQMKQPNMTLQEYLDIIIGKTGYLIQTCCLSGAILAGSDQGVQEIAKTFGLNLGIAFQLVDDALDYSAGSNHTGKTLGGDLREGKLTLPLIFFLQTLKDNLAKELILKIKEKKLSTDERNWIFSQIDRLQLIQKTRNQAQEYLHGAQQAVYKFPPRKERDLLLEILSYIKHRQH